MLYVGLENTLKCIEELVYLGIAGQVTYYIKNDCNIIQRTDVLTIEHFFLVSHDQHVSRSSSTSLAFR